MPKKFAQPCFRRESIQEGDKKKSAPLLKKFNYMQRLVHNLSNVTVSSKSVLSMRMIFLHLIPWDNGSFSTPLALPGGLELHPLPLGWPGSTLGAENGLGIRIPQFSLIFTGNSAVCATTLNLNKKSLESVEYEGGRIMKNGVNSVFFVSLWPLRI